MAPQPHQVICDESCAHVLCNEFHEENINKEPCEHGFQPISVTLVEGNDFSSLRQYLRMEMERLNDKFHNATLYGRLDEPESTKDCVAPDPPAKLQKAYEEVNIWWEEFESGASKIGRLYKNHLHEYQRKHGPRGVFSELARLYPERIDEIGKDESLHSDISMSYQMLSRQVSFVKLSLQHWIVLE